MPYIIVYTKKVIKKDLKELSTPILKQIKQAIEYIIKILTYIRVFDRSMTFEIVTQQLSEAISKQSTTSQQPEISRDLSLEEQPSAPPKSEESKNV